jgi:hypothetical protein
MTINDTHPRDLIEHRLKQHRAEINKIASDAKDVLDGFLCTYEHSNSRRDDFAMRKLLAADDISELCEMAKDL